MSIKTRSLRFEPLSKLPHGSMLFGLEYVSPNNVHSWCYLTVSGNVVIATQLDSNTGLSITNSWDRAFFAMLQQLPRIKEIENPCWFEHYTHEREHERCSKGMCHGPTLDEVFFIDRGPDAYCGEVKWEYLAHGNDVTSAWKQLTGDDIPDFAATGFESEMILRVRDRPYIHEPPEDVVSVYIARCRICGAMATIEPEASAGQMQLWIHQNKPCPGYPVEELLRKSSPQNLEG